MKTILTILFAFCSMAASAQILSDINGDSHTSIADVTNAINAYNNGAKISIKDINAVIQAVMDKRNSLVVWLASGKKEIHYFDNKPIVTFVNEDIVITTDIDELIGSDGVIYQSKDVLKITYDYISKVHEGQIDNLEDILG